MGLASRARRAIAPIVENASTLALLLALVLGGCPGTARPLDDGAACRGPAVSGQVVDLESCFSAAGCGGVAEMKVSIFEHEVISSPKTNPDGAYQLTCVPDGVSSYLLVTDASGSPAYLSTLQANAVRPGGANIFTHEVRAFKASGGLYEALGRATGANITSEVLYYGQVYRAEAGALIPVEGARVSSQPPARQLHIVDCNPRFQPSACTKPFDPSWTTTGRVGGFFLNAPAGGELTVTVTSASFAFDPITVRAGRGYLTLGYHEGKPRAAGTGSP